MALVGRFELESAAWTEPRLFGVIPGQQARWSERVELEAALLVVERFALAAAKLYSLAPSIGDSSINPAAFSSPALTYGPCQSIPPPGNVVLRK